MKYTIICRHDYYMHGNVGVFAISTENNIKGFWKCHPWLIVENTNIILWVLRNILLDRSTPCVITRGYGWGTTKQIKEERNGSTLRKEFDKDAILSTPTSTLQWGNRQRFNANIITGVRIGGMLLQHLQFADNADRPTSENVEMSWAMQSKEIHSRYQENVDPGEMLMACFLVTIWKDTDISIDTIIRIVWELR